MLMRIGQHGGCDKPPRRIDQARVGNDISSVVSADLERSGLFRPLDPKSFIQQPDQIRLQLERLDDQYLIAGEA